MTAGLQGVRELFRLLPSGELGALLPGVCRLASLESILFHPAWLHGGKFMNSALGLLFQETGREALGPSA